MSWHNQLLAGTCRKWPLDILLIANLGDFCKLSWYNVCENRFPDTENKIKKTGKFQVPINNISSEQVTFLFVFLNCICSKYSETFTESCTELWYTHELIYNDLSKFQIFTVIHLFELVRSSWGCIHSPSDLVKYNDEFHKRRKTERHKAALELLLLHGLCPNSQTFPLQWGKTFSADCSCLS